jgi:hypothetical protein
MSPGTDKTGIAEQGIRLSRAGERNCQYLWMVIVLGGCLGGVVVGSFDELSVGEGGAVADEGDQVGCVDRAPAVLGGFR